MHLLPRLCKCQVSKSASSEERQFIMKTYFSSSGIISLMSSATHTFTVRPALKYNADIAPVRIPESGYRPIKISLFTDNLGSHGAPITLNEHANAPLLVWEPIGPWLIQGDTWWPDTPKTGSRPAKSITVLSKPSGPRAFLIGPLKLVSIAPIIYLLVLIYVFVSKSKHTPIWLPNSTHGSWKLGKCDRTPGQARYAGLWFVETGHAQSVQTSTTIEMTSPYPFLMLGTLNSLLRTIQTI